MRFLVKPRFRRYLTTLMECPAHGLKRLQWRDAIGPDIVYQCEYGVVQLAQNDVGIIFARSAILWNGAAGLCQSSE